MTKPAFAQKLKRAQEEGRRLVAPLIGFPGLTMTQSTIKLAQQNYGEHFKVMKALVETFAPDVIFPLMDLSVEANALGRFTVFPQAEAATVPKAPFDIDELERIGRINIALDTRLLGYVETVKLMSFGLPDSTIKGAYVTGPYSLAALLMGAEDAAMMTVLEPEDLHTLCHFATRKIQQYTRMLITAGAQVICVLEPSAVMLGPKQFEAFSANYVRSIVEVCSSYEVPTVYHTCGNTMGLVETMAKSGVQALSLDSREAGVDLPAVAEKIPSDVVVIGNINPTGALLNGTPAEVDQEVEALLQQMAPYSNFILSSGCDLPQLTPLDNIHAFMQAGRRYRMP